MRGRSSIFRDLGILTAAQIAAQLLNLVALVYIARQVGARWFGVLQIGVAVSAYALITAEWGMFNTGIREMARLERKDEVLAYARRHTGLLAALACIVLLVGGAVLPRFPFFDEDPWVYALYLLAVVPQVWMLDWVGVGLERMTWVGVAKVTRSLVYALAVLCLLAPLDGWLGWPAWRWVPALLLLSLSAGDVVIGLWLTRWLGEPVWPVWGGRRDWRTRLGAAGPIGAAIVVMRLLLNMDVLVLGIFRQPEEVGAYAAAAKLLFVLVIAVEVLWSALLPRLSRLWQESPARFRARLSLYFGLLVAGFAPAAAAGVAVGRPLMHAVYGQQFPGAGEVFQILSVSYLLLAASAFFGNALVACDRQRDAFPPVLAGAAVGLIGTFLLAPRGGGVGAAWAMLGAHAVLLAATGWVARRILERALLATVALCCGAAGLMGLAIGAWTGAWPLPARILAGAILYGAVIARPLWSWARRARAVAA